ncbi:hypothetical protein LSPH24S_06846 [Lysinibacillus sphaericus]
MAILHITFSLSTQGPIKHTIRQNHLQREESVICIHDNFSYWPTSKYGRAKKLVGYTYF